MFKPGELVTQTVDFDGEGGDVRLTRAALVVRFVKSVTYPDGHTFDVYDAVDLMAEPPRRVHEYAIARDDVKAG